MFGALAMLLPERVCAASDGGNTGVSIGGYDDARRPFIFVDFSCGTWGGRPWADGLQGNSNMFANMASQSAEVVEAEHPVQILAYELVPDRAGPGKYRGGAPYRRDFRFSEKEAVLQVRSDRHAILPYGLYGGYPGKPSMNYLNPDSNPRPLNSKLTTTIRRGDVFRHELAGGGGWGDPLERDPERVLADVRNEYVSADAAASEYGVVVDCAQWQVDGAATSALRERLRAARGPVAEVCWQAPAAPGAAAQ
jgi:N-methylhydantoinase B